MPNTRPDQIFDENGVCNACLSFLRNKNINWNKRFEEFNEIVKEVKTLNNKWNCVIPSVEGKTVLIRRSEQES